MLLDLRAQIELKQQLKAREWIQPSQVTTKKNFQIEKQSINKSPLLILRSAQNADVQKKFLQTVYIWYHY